MKLKYNLIAWSLLGFFAAACDPMDDIYNEIDAEGTTNTQTMAEYVLTDADYETISSAAAKAATSDAEKALANAVKTDKALNEFASAEKYVPSIIAKMLPSWGKGSSVGVTTSTSSQKRGQRYYARTCTQHPLDQRRLAFGYARTLRSRTPSSHYRRRAHRKLGTHRLVLLLRSSKRICNHDAGRRPHHYRRNMEKRHMEL